MIESVLYTVSDTCFGVIRFVIFFILSIFYRGKGKIVPPVTDPLLLRSATRLALEIREGKLKSEDVIQAYIDRIVEVNPYINATVDFCFTDALKKAKEVDSLIASRKYSKEQLADEKPLLGVPISVKLLLNVKDLRSTAGSRFFENQIASEDAPSVAMMKKAGAIVIATTNVPELGMIFESTNFVHGTTRNPFDTNRTSGGSSGGESALIGAGGSVLGLGSDLLGSLRLPAHFTGIFSHKPTRGLVPNEGTFIEVPEDLNSNISTGPLCRYAEDLITSMKVLSSESGVRILFEQQVDFKKLKICYLSEIKGLWVAPVDEDIAIALKNAISYFVNRYDLITNEVKMPILHDANRCVFSAIMPPLIDIMSATLRRGGIHFSEKLDFLKFFFGKSILSFTPLLVFNLSQFPLWYRESQTSYYKEMLKEWIKVFDSLLDENTVMLLPTLPVTAPHHFGMLPLLPSTCYTSIFNVLGLPSTQCPMGYNENGMPYGIQVVARKRNDALTIACAVELEKAFGGWKSPGNL